MLKSVFGRDLLLYVGSVSADLLYYDATGVARLWNLVWHDVGRKPILLPANEHPLGSIETRVSAAYVATYLWIHLFRRTHNRNCDVSKLLVNEYRNSGNVFWSLKSRWSRADLDQLKMLLK